MTEDKMVGWHHQLNGHEFDQTLGDGEGQGSLVCCSPWGCKELDTTEWLNNILQKSGQILLQQSLEGSPGPRRSTQILSVELVYSDG